MSLTLKIQNSIRSDQVYERNTEMEFLRKEIHDTL